MNPALPEPQLPFSCFKSSLTSFASLHKILKDDTRRKAIQLLSESETLRAAFLEYARSISLIAEKVHAAR